MKTLNKVKVTPVYVEIMPLIQDMKEDEIYISKKYNTAIHTCLCGCKEEVVTPLNKYGWNLIEENNKITLSPSIGNYQFACRSHYIITKNVANFV